MPETKEKRFVGMTIRCLSRMISRRLEGLHGKDSDSTRYHGRVVGYLSRRRGEDVFQRDIEAHFGIQRSTATRLLQLMESNGLIRRESVPSDARLKKITLTDKGVAFDERVRGEIDRFEAALVRGFSEEELNEFFRLADKLEATLSEMERENREGAPPSQKNKT
ncbi:MAG: MarR family transcriptional regulator [Bacteroides sp.]|nr:MarR family transcriptional regulator [Eubacterium sp.]MCM1417986.1 MarR family transcriptional regulator [Roseburia sp.]MCM1461767.1 MarR family transcriptional regulator [Bacteroides sp.]